MPVPSESESSYSISFILGGSFADLNPQNAVSGDLPRAFLPSDITFTIRNIDELRIAAQKARKQGHVLKISDVIDARNLFENSYLGKYSISGDNKAIADTKIILSNFKNNHDYRSIFYTDSHNALMINPLNMKLPNDPATFRATILQGLQYAVQHHANGNHKNLMAGYPTSRWDGGPPKTMKRSFTNQAELEGLYVYHQAISKNTIPLPYSKFIHLVKSLPDDTLFQDGLHGILKSSNDAGKPNESPKYKPYHENQQSTEAIIALLDGSKMPQKNVLYSLVDPSISSIDISIGEEFVVNIDRNNVAKFMYDYNASDNLRLVGIKTKVNFNNNKYTQTQSNTSKVKRAASKSVGVGGFGVSLAVGSMAAWDAARIALEKAAKLAGELDMHSMKNQLSKASKFIEEHPSFLAKFADEHPAKAQVIFGTLLGLDTVNAISIAKNAKIAELSKAGRLAGGVSRTLGVIGAAVSVVMFVGQYDRNKKLQESDFLHFTDKIHKLSEKQTTISGLGAAGAVVGAGAMVAGAPITAVGAFVSASVMGLWGMAIAEDEKKAMKEHEEFMIKLNALPEDSAARSVYLSTICAEQSIINRIHKKEKEREGPFETYNINWQIEELEKQLAGLKKEEKIIVAHIDNLNKHVTRTAIVSTGASYVPDIQSTHVAPDNTTARGI